MRTLQFSTRLVFHAHDDFLLHRRNGVDQGSKYFEYVADAHRRGIIQP